MGNWPRMAVPATGMARHSLWVTAASFPTTAKTPSLSPGQSHDWDFKVRPMQALPRDWTVKDWHLPSGRVFDKGSQILKDLTDVGEIFQEMKKGVRAVIKRRQNEQSTALVRHHYFTFNHQYLSPNYIDFSIGSSAGNFMKKPTSLKDLNSILVICSVLQKSNPKVFVANVQ